MTRIRKWEGQHICLVSLYYIDMEASRLTTHSSRCLEAFHCSSAVSGWWSIETSNGPHPIDYKCFQAFLIDQFEKFFLLVFHFIINVCILIMYGCWHNKRLRANKASIKRTEKIVRKEKKEGNYVEDNGLI